ncbi:MAG: CD1871A family CXXC motif-containing protein [Spirochaetales bacterium]
MNEKTDIGSGKNPEKKSAMYRITQIALLALAGIFIFIGILRGEAGVMFQKAVLICLECIGVG